MFHGRKIAIVLALPLVGALLLTAHGLRWLALRLISAGARLAAVVEGGR